jgi:threonyl-tRNA synthetase
VQVAGVLDMMKTTYRVLGFTYELNLSTRPKKALGSKELWDAAEGMMKEALDRFGEPWRINAGDGAFYGPKVGPSFVPPPSLFSSLLALFTSLQHSL